ncbi:fibrocystin-L-like isoform X3 [Ostrea edulis]|uniref:fibrocystin-L-like isoform X3 n=1 Tax=Ostrea edulis TaxID=37623 RepID=UPI0024AFF119|nr:fibrocystin-L-like isoform X3 [Ostrea edulis]
MLRRPQTSVVFLSLSILGTVLSSEVTHIDPRLGSTNGGTKVTLYGSGFAANQFNWGSGNENLGNEVTIVSGTQSYATEIHKDGSNENQIQFFTPPLPAGKYSFRVKVDGKEVTSLCVKDSSKCNFETNSWATPTIEEVYPRSGEPGTLLTLRGRIVTTRYGSNIAESDNGREEKLLRIYAPQGYKCEMKPDGSDTFFGIGLNSETSLKGYFTCQTTGTYVTNGNISYIVEGQFGRSLPVNDVLKYSGNNVIQMFQTYAVINSVTPSLGSTSGGTQIKLTGRFFNNTEKTLRVEVGGEPCTNLKLVSDSEITCDTPAQPPVQPYYTGSRGLLFESWTSTAKTFDTIDDVLTMDSSASDYNSSLVDETYFEDNSNKSFVSRLSGLFIPSHNSSYRFFIKCDNYAALYFSTSENAADKQKIATCSKYSNSFFDRSEQASTLVTLTAGKKYYLMILHGEYFGGAFVRVGVKMFTSPVSNQMCGSADQEKQTVKVASTKVKEVQTVSLSNFNDQDETYTPEKQTVVVSNIGGNEQITFRLGLYGVFTGPLKASSDGTAIEAALNLLPVIAPDTVSISATTGSTSNTFEITFNSALGDIPMLQTKIDVTGSSLSVSATETQKGVAGRKSVRFSMDGKISPAFTYGGPVGDVQAAVEGLFSVRCPSTFVAGDNKYFQDFEDQKAVEAMGKIISYVSPFCGRHAIINPKFIYKASDKKLGISVTQYGVVCFAYFGPIKSLLRVNYNFYDKTKLTTESATNYLTIANAAASTKWNYVCVDILDALSTLKTDGSSFEAREMNLYREDNAVDDLLVDAVIVVRSDLATDTQEGIREQRMVGATPGGFPMKTLQVEENAGVYTITMSPNNCSFGIPLLGLGNAQASQSDLVASTSASFSTSTKAGSTVSMTTSRTSAASPPVTGTVGFTFEGKTVEIPAKALETEVKDLLMTIPNIGNVHVKKEGDCAEFEWQVTWLSRMGDLPAATVDGTKLRGISPAATIQTVQNGGLWYNPIPGDMLRTYESTPQVIAYVNDIPTRCEGTCKFEWQASSTPVVSAISPTSAYTGDSLTITGTSFGASAADNSVTIGGVACTVTSASSTQLVCTVGAGTGSHAVEVNVAGVGLASGSFSFSYNTRITSITPTSGSLAGGSRLTVAGSGFSPTAVVAVNTDTCTVVTATTSEIVCLTPSASTPGSASVTLAQAGTTLTASQQFNYDAALTANINSVSPSSSSVTGGGTLVLQGTGFGSTQPAGTTLVIGSEPATIISYSDTQVEATLPAQAAGDHVIKFSVGNNGYAANSASTKSIAYRLKVTNISPRSGSLYGGTIVTVTGQGFGNTASNIKANMGSYKCDVVGTVTDTQFKCQIEATGKVHQVSNQGASATYGVGYAWSPMTLDVHVGDYIEWKWSVADGVTGINIGVHQTKTAVATTSSGFSSGAGTPSGAYKYQVTRTGDVFYWSDYVDANSKIAFRGSIKAMSRPQSVEDFGLKLGGYEAEYDTTSGVADPAASGCEVTSSISGCTDAPPTGGSAGKFHFSFETCRSPSVSSISHDQGHAAQDITLSGSGFGATGCQHKIDIGDYTCSVSSASAGSLVCNVDGSTQPGVGVMKELQVSVLNRGYALLATSKVATFVLLPHVSSYSPQEGSMKGGFTLTINGGGFNANTVVTIDAITCEITSVTYDRIICTAPSLNTYSSKPLVVKVPSNGNNLEAKCSDPLLSCSIRYAQTSTPTVASVTPDSVSGSSTALTIEGTLFGTTASAVTVSIGDASCSVTAVTNTQIQCTVGTVPVGSQDVSVVIDGVGRAATTVKVQSEAVLTSITPSSGSTNGGALVTIAGNGFVANKTTVTIGGNACTVNDVTSTAIQCTTPAGTGSATVAVVSDGVTYGSVTYTYDPSATPTITTLTPQSGNPGQTLTISGSGFGSGSVKVSVGDTDCSVTSSSATEIRCTLGVSSAGSKAVVVDVVGKGVSSNSNQFTYSLALGSISPSSGSLGGGQTVTITGHGFSPKSTVTICGQACSLDSSASQSDTQFVCSTPVHAAGGCDVVATEGSETNTLASSYTYDSSVTPTITSVNPTYGGTAGGTSVTVSGTGFGTNSAAVSVKIGGVACAIDTISDTSLTCTTGARSSSIDTAVSLQVATNGIADQTNAAFRYIDVWSSPTTWVGGTLPGEGEMIVIQENQTILLDVSTPILGMLLIQGGKVIFDEKDIELNAKYILITDNGALEVGKEGAPFQHQATITMHGVFRSPELPIYGSKSLGVREGTLDLHGKPKVTWTRLAATANSGSSSITLQQGVDWEVGDQIVLATTGHRHSQEETETKRVASVSADGKTVTLDSPLTYTHVRVTETYGTATVDMAGEVGLLSHNVRFRGYGDPEWVTNITKCEAGFDTGEFTTQTCFQGRFGDEMGSDQFGGHILIHAPKPDLGLATARIEYVEFTHVGQAFRLGRYPIHSHLNGDMSASYVRGCGLHKTFNRAVNVHKTHNLLVEHNVIYNVMGGSFFLEDGIETGNIFQYNLAIFVISSTSLLNDDITPACFWVTNPNNTIRHNAAAGGTHFGFWYRMHEHPDGPSFDPNICPRHVPLGEFQNNTVHSMGWFGLWIFQEYHPRKDGSCDVAAEHEVAKFRSLTVWNCEKGAEAVNAGALQFHDFHMIHNEKAGYEGKLIKHSPQNQENASYAVVDSIMVANSPGLTAVSGQKSYCTIGGIVLPYGNGMMVINTDFYNFDQSNCNAFTLTKIDGTCTVYCGGYSYRFKEISFTNSPNHGKFDWKWQAVMIDMDGSLSGGAAGSQLTPTSATLPSSCTSDTNFNKGVPASLCPGSLKFHRVALNNIEPVSLEGQRMILNNSYGSDYADFGLKRISHKPGWIGTLIDGETYRFSWEDGEKITNVSYHATFYQFEDPSNNVKICQRFERKPDRFSLDGNTFNNASVTPMVYGTNKNGDWEFHDSEMELCYLVSGKTSRRKKRGSGAMPVYAEDRDCSVTAFKCYYTDCVPPPDPDTIPPTCTRPSNATKWSDVATWQTAAPGWGGNLGNGQYGLPQQGDKVKIPKGYWVILDQPIPSFAELVIEGTLELDHGPAKTNSYTIDVTYLYILGGRLIIGCEEAAPFEGEASIILRGDPNTAPYPVTEGPNVGSKVIAVFGGLDIHGKNHTVTWTTLSQTAASGANQISLTDTVDWAVNDEIVITSTSYMAWEVEVRKISAISADKRSLTLNESLSHKHISMEESFSNGEKYSMRAEVGLLSRNVKIIGAVYPNMFSDSYGARVLVGVTADPTRRYTGFARLSNVEFFRGGQEGYTATYDPRHALSFVDIPISNVKPCYVKQCSFHHNLGIAIGVYGTNNLEIQNNVIYHSVGSAIHTKSAGTAIRNNLISLNLWPGSYIGRSEPMNIYYDGSVDGVKASGTILQGNAISSSERSGYHGDFESCTATDTWFDNIFHSNLMAVGIFPIDKVNPPTCWRIANMSIWKNYNYGVFYQSVYEISMEKLTLVDNNVGIFPMIIGPAALDHAYQNKKVTISKSLVVGKSSVFDCANDKMDFSLPYVNLRRTFDKSWRIETKGRTGISISIFSSGPNNAPEKPFAGIMAYNAIAGFTTITDTTFANFQTGSSGECGMDIALATDPNNDDACHPTELTGNRKFNVGAENTVYYHRPRLSKVNPSDCVDMDCDGHKKCLVKDTDGSLFGSPTTIVPQAEFEWDGDPRRGLGDYRIPKPILTAPGGAVLTVEQVAKYKGVLRDDTCTYNNNQQVYKCTDYTYRQLTIESMDADTELRRLSPVAILAWNGNGDGFIDLINGPQDHGWCAGYTCQKRLSTFQAIAASGRNYSLYFSSTAPQHLRLMMLNTPSSERIRVGAYNSKPNRLDVFVNGEYKLPKNGQLDSNKNLILQAPTSVNQYNPKVDTDPCGTNYMDRDWQEMQIIVCGGDEVEIKMSPQIVVGFNVPTMTVDQFFGPNLLNNLATFLGIPSDKIRTMQVQSGVSRRRRSTGTNTMYYIEVGNPPCTDINCTTVVSAMSYTDQQTLASKIINQYQLGNLSDILNITINGVAVAEALPPTSDPNWAKVVESSDYVNTIKVPTVMEFQTEITAGTEGNAFPVQPVLQFKDSNGDRVTLLGATAYPWKVEVSLRTGSGSNSLATLVGNTTMSFIDGWANFTGLGISHSGTGYILDFKVIEPSEASFTLASTAISVAQRLLTSSVTYTSPDVYQGSSHTINLDIRDKDTGIVLPDIAWSGLNWYVNTSLVSGLSYTGSMSTSTPSKAFDPMSGLVILNDLQLDTIGMAHVKFTVYSVPAQYSHEVIHELTVYPTEAQSVTIDTTNTINVKFDLDFATYGNTQFGAVVLNYFQSRYHYMKMSNLQVSQGSVVVTITVSGNSTTVLEVTEAMCTAIKDGTTFTYGGTTVSLKSYMTVNGASYCSDESSAETDKDDDKEKEIRALMIIGICIAVLLVILIVVAVLVWRLKVYPKTKTHRSQCKQGMHSDGDAVYIGKGKGTFFFEDSFYRQDTFNSLRTENSFLEDGQKPPINTTFYEKSPTGPALSRHF